MKVIEYFFPVMLFVEMYKVALTFKSVGKNLKCKHSRENYYKYYFHVLLCVVLQKVIQNLAFVGKILKCDHSNKIHGELSCGTV